MVGFATADFVRRAVLEETVPEVDIVVAAKPKVFLDHFRQQGLSGGGPTRVVDLSLLALSLLGLVDVSLAIDVSVNTVTPLLITECGRLAPRGTGSYPSRAAPGEGSSREPAMHVPSREPHQILQGASVMVTWSVVVANICSARHRKMETARARISHLPLKKCRETPKTAR